MKAYIEQIIAYNYAAHRRLWSCIDHLTDEQFTTEVDYSIGSVRNHMVHVISVDQRWMARVTDSPLPERLKGEDFPDRTVARTRWDAIEQSILERVKALDEAQLERVITYEVTRINGEKIQAVNTAWQILAHIVNHGTDHRSQVLPILHRFGAPTFEQDFMIYLWEQHG
jgi:uncharacterized damage-inducible protein DinB